MDYAACNVVYVDRAARKDELLKKGDVPSSLDDGYEERPPLIRQPSHLDANLQILLKTFAEVHICTTGVSCMRKLAELNQSSIKDSIPTLVLIDIPYDDRLQVAPVKETARDPSPGSQLQVDGPQDMPSLLDGNEAYGLKLLQWVSSEIQYHSLSQLVVPVAVVAIPEGTQSDTERKLSNSHTDGATAVTSLSETDWANLVTPLDHVRTTRYLDVGAVDVLTSPLLHERLPSLGIHAYRAHREASEKYKAQLEIKRGRKRSWVGVNSDERPYAYLREAMVSGLMDGICKLGEDTTPIRVVGITVALDRRHKISEAIGSWNFCAHEFSDDELLHAALLILQHALTMPELEKWRISTEQLTQFLVASRAAYNSFVPYHNFRHVVDVLQAIFHFLVQLGRLPPYPVSSSRPVPEPSTISSLIRPFDALTLLITVIGHDVGHPGVNNAFLVVLNAPLAQLYNDRSVLESFHCAAYSQILRRHWPAAFEDLDMRKLMISSILATDMGLHFDYMKQLGNLQEKLHENGDREGWNGRFTEEQRSLACSLLIKCADISNVARTYTVASQWTRILTNEFSRQAEMEKDLDIPSSLFAAPATEIIPLASSQIGFINMFATPLFQGVTDVMPAMKYCVDELNLNLRAWEHTIAQEKARSEIDNNPMADGMFSPRSMSVVGPTDSNHSIAHNDLRLAAVLNSTMNSNNPFIKYAPSGDGVAPNPFIRAVPDEGAGLGQYHSLPDITTTDFVPENDKDPSQDPSMPYFAPRNFKAPSRVVASSPNLAHRQHAGFTKSISPIDDTLSESDTSVADSGPTIVNDAPVIDQVTKTDDKSPPAHGKSQSSDSTEAPTTGDSASQATSATTGKMPLSPTTPGTSVMSKDSLEATNDADAGLSSVASQFTSSEASEDTKEGRFNKLRKRSSRVFKNIFSHRGSSTPPPLPTTRRDEKTASTSAMSQ